MNEKNDRVARIKWSPLYSAEEAVAAAGRLANSWGLYQFYGYHPVYSKDDDDKVLLYIGISTNLARRLSGHAFLSEWVQAHFKPDKIRISLSESVEGDVLLEDIEALLIYAHAPGWNSEYISTYDATHYSDQDHFRVVNEGWKQRPGGLHDEVSTRAMNVFSQGAWV